MRDQLVDQTLRAVKSVQSASIRHPQGTYIAELKRGVIYVRLVSTDGDEEAAIIDGDTVTAADSAAITHPELIDELTRRGFAVQWVDAII